ncbi:MAG: GC-type dockerin domain-anchored protein [Phycisphaerales bacterium]
MNIHQRVALGVLVLTFGLAGPAAAGPPCTGYQLGLTSSFITSGNPSQGQLQHPANAWTFRHTDMTTGPLLTGGVAGGSALGAWVTEGQPFVIPVVGAVYSPDPLVNQMTGAFNRSPMFTGLLAHPGYPGLPLYLIWTVQSEMSLSNFVGNVEVLSPGGPSDGVSISVLQVKASGTFTIFGPFDVLPTQDTSQALNYLPIIPQPLHTGDKLVVMVDPKTQPFEDWVNLDIRFNVLGSPQILKQPDPVSQCNDREARFSIVLSNTPPLTMYQWRRNGQNLTDGTTALGTISGANTAELTLTHITSGLAGSFDCVFDGPCGGFASAAAELRVRQCPCNLADVTQLGGSGLPDGFLTVDDIIVYLNAFFSGNLVIADVAALGGAPGADGQLTVDDVIVFLAAFFEGCAP